jgi:mannobiose 2-epimerase
LDLTSRLRDSATALERVLSENVVPFWLDGIVDRERGGYRLNHDPSGRWLGPAPRRLITQARTLWFLSRLVTAGRAVPDALPIAGHGFDFLRRRFWDPVHGGVFWEIGPEDGMPTMPDKHVCAQGIALFAVSEFALASGDAGAGLMADELFDLLETRFRDAEGGGYREFFGRDWRELPPGTVGYMSAPPDVKLIDTHIHVLEGLTAYARLRAGGRALTRLAGLTGLLAAVAHDARGLGGDRYRRDWRSLRSRRRISVSYGHQVELAWLLLDALRPIGARPEAVLEACRTLTDNAIRHGYDDRRGGFFHFGLPRLPAHRRTKIWWVQAEALPALLWLYRLTDRARYAECYLGTLDWILERQVDWEHGDWHAEVLPDGRIVGEKAGIWKEPYHHGRALIEGLNLLGVA